MVVPANVMFFLHIHANGVNPPLVSKVVGDVSVSRGGIAVDAHAEDFVEDWRGGGIVVVDRVGLDGILICGVRIGRVVGLLRVPWADAGKGQEIAMSDLEVGDGQSNSARSGVVTGKMFGSDDLEGLLIGIGTGRDVAQSV